MSPSSTTCLTPPPTKLRSSKILLLDRFTRNSFPGVICAAVILLLTGLPGSCLPHVKPIVGFDKVVHVLMYAGFTFAALWGYRQPFQERGKAYRRKSLWLVLTIGIVYGALTEIMQETLVPGRTGSVYDWIADIIGSVLGVATFFFYQQRGNKMKNESLVNK